MTYLLRVGVNLWPQVLTTGHFTPFPNSSLQIPCPLYPYLWPLPSDGLHLGFLAQLVRTKSLHTCWEDTIFKEALLSQAPLFENNKILPLELERLCDGTLSIPPVPFPDHPVTEESRQQVGHDG